VSSHEDPPKLLEELANSGADRDLQLGLGQLTKRLPSEAQLARMAAAIGLEPAAPAAPAKSDVATAASAKPALLATGGIVAVGGTLLALWALQTPDTSRNERSQAELARPTASAAVVASSPPELQNTREKAFGTAGARPSESEGPPATTTGVAADVPGEPTQPLASAIPAPDATTTPDTQVAPPARAPALPRPTPKPSVASTAAAAPKLPPAIGISETQILRDARLVLDRDPRSALALSEQHRRDYPNGSFTQERELIAITALVKLGRQSEASDRAARFRSAYPSSPYRARLDRIVP
jgi:hypothetical protein